MRTDVKIGDAVFLTHWFVSRSVAEVVRRNGRPMAEVLAEAARFHRAGWALPYRPLEDPAPPRNPRIVLAPFADDPDGLARVDGDGRAWVPAARSGRGATCQRCGGAVGPNGFNRLSKRGDPGRRFACPGCAKSVSLPASPDQK